MFTKRWSLVVTRLFFLSVFSATCAVILSGCGSMVSSKEELQNVSENEGVVFGSLVIDVEKGQEKESGWAFLQGKKLVMRRTQ